MKVVLFFCLISAVVAYFDDVASNPDDCLALAKKYVKHCAKIEFFVPEGENGLEAYFSELKQNIAEEKNDKASLYSCEVKRSEGVPLEYLNVKYHKDFFYCGFSSEKY